MHKWWRSWYWHCWVPRSHRSWAERCGSPLPQCYCPCPWVSCLSVSGAPWRASFARRSAQTCVRRTHKRRASRRCACGCAWLDGHCDWRIACRCGTGKVCVPCGFAGDASIRLIAKSDGRSSPDRRAVARAPEFCSAGWGTFLVEWVWGRVSERVDGVGKCAVAHRESWDGSVAYP